MKFPEMPYTRVDMEQVKKELVKNNASRRGTTEKD